MRLCRFRHQGKIQAGFYDDRRIVPLAAAAEAHASATHQTLSLSAGDDLLEFLPPDGKGLAAVRRLYEWIGRAAEGLQAVTTVDASQVELLVPVPRPNKLFLLAGNYADHVQEGGEVAAQRAETFPYVFMKPPTTTLTHPNQPVRIPKISPGAIDWELELAVVIGRACKGVSEGEALKYVAGYTVINDISNRKFRPNPNRKKRDKDTFFDWLHGKWHDSFCPCGPCITSGDAISDPQSLQMTLKLNGETRQHGSTGQQIFPVAALIEFISGIVTLEPGDIISTGTLGGVGSSTNTFLKPGDRLDASIEGIGTLSSPVVAE